MPFRRLALILLAVLAAGAGTVALIAALPDHGLAVLIPLALAGVVILRLTARRK